MKDQEPQFQYIHWKNMDEMHYSSMEWLSELDFFQDEHRFFEDMLKEYTMPIIESHLFFQVKELITQLTESQKSIQDLKKQVEAHNKRIRLPEKIQEKKEEGKLYRKEHYKILAEINKYSKIYKHLKRDIFETVSQALKQQKQNRLLT